jgi:AraC-like DNA-binding protein
LYGFCCLRLAINPTLKIREEEVLLQAMTRSIFHDSSMSVELRKYAAGYTMAPHKHDYLTISLLMQGNLVEDCETGRMLPSTGFLSVKPPDVMHSDVFVNDCTFLSLKIYDFKYYSLFFNEWQWVRPGIAIKHLVNIIGQTDKREAFGRLACYLSAAEADNAGGNPPPWLTQVHKTICEHYTEKLRISDIAKEAGKHPFYVARAFKKFYGTDIITYKRTLRIHHAFSDALDKKESLTGLACEYEFADQSHFCREFKKVTALSPQKAISLFNV